MHSDECLHHLPPLSQNNLTTCRNMIYNLHMTVNDGETFYKLFYEPSLFELLLKFDNTTKVNGIEQCVTTYRWEEMGRPSYDSEYNNDLFIRRSSSSSAHELIDCVFCFEFHRRHNYLSENIKNKYICWSFSKNDDDCGNSKLRIISLSRLHIHPVISINYWKIPINIRRTILYELKYSAFKYTINHPKYKHIQLREAISTTSTNGVWCYDKKNLRVGDVLFFFHTNPSREHLHLHTVVCMSDGGIDLKNRVIDELNGSYHTPYITWQQIWILQEEYANRSWNSFNCENPACSNINLLSNWTRSIFAESNSNHGPKLLISYFNDIPKYNPSTFCSATCENHITHWPT